MNMENICLSSCDFYLNIADFSLEFHCPIPVVIGPLTRFYLDFVSLDKPKFRVAHKIKVVIEDFLMSSDVREVMTYADNSWRLFKCNNEFIVQIKSEADKLPVWTLKFDRDFLNIKVYCNASLENILQLSLMQMITLHALFNRNGLMLHSMAAIVDGRGYVFPGVSGVGKSTLAQLFYDCDFGRVIIDEKAILTNENDKFYIYGSPWPSRAQAAQNCGAELAGIFFIAHGDEPIIKKLSPTEAVRRFFPVASIPWYDEEFSDIAFKVLEKLVKNFPVYEFSYRPDSVAIEALKAIINAQ